jgi:serine/threonine protein kinase
VNSEHKQRFEGVINHLKRVQGRLPRGHPLLQGIAGRTIAVKRLRRSSDIPEIIVSYFTREMQLISGLKQHQNVVRLLAYCNEDNEQILAYEYMHRRSLDAYIFGTKLLLTTKCRQCHLSPCLKL